VNSVERTKEVKKKLVKVFPRDIVSVRNGRGTAYGWVEIRIHLSRLVNCPEKPDHGCGWCPKWGNCPIFKEIRIKGYRQVEEAIRGIEFNTYPDDMNRDQPEYTIDID